jgi:uncharacterized protein (TIGR03905 family)
MKHTFKTTGTCASVIEFDKDEKGIVTNVKFTGGCNGNLKAIAKLVDGMTSQEISNILKGNLCGAKGTSCADQLARAVSES